MGHPCVTKWTDLQEGPSRATVAIDHFHPAVLVYRSFNIIQEGTGARMNSSDPYSPHSDWSVIPLAAAATELLGKAEEEGKVLSEENWEETLAWAHTSLSSSWGWSGPGLTQVEQLWTRASLEKSWGEAERVRKLAGQRYSERKLAAALALYNKAVALAPSKGGQLGLLFANRALILLEQGAPGQALGQLQLAEMEGYPADKSFKLLARRAVCLTRLGRKEEAEKWFVKAENAAADVEEIGREAARRLVEKNRREAGSVTTGNLGMQPGDGWVGAAEEALLASANPLYPSLTSRVKVVASAEAGRHLVATRFIEAGHLVAVDTPSLTWLASARADTNCLNCLASCHLPLPCPSCTSALFCSLACRTKALNSHHRFECRLGLADLAIEEERRKLNTSTVASGLFMVVRVLTQKTWDHFLKNKEKIEKEMRGRTNPEGDDSYLSTDYMRLLGLVRHPEPDQLSQVDDGDGDGGHVSEEKLRVDYNFNHFVRLGTLPLPASSSPAFTFAKPLTFYLHLWLFDRSLSSVTLSS